ncbi:hypothetical protein KU720_22065, partial [Salmonella enterica subsp. enterica serovar Give]|nr:hypothetical protein [Salmonella enterica subsp. enterica serovar Give]
IYTVTLNPSIDYIVKLNELKTGSTNRVNEKYVYPGGKGINVSRILKELGNDNISLGFISGFTGEYIIRTLEEKNLKTDFIKIKNGFSRINVKIKESEKTEINGQGPNIDDEDIDILYKKLDKLNQDDILILAGSIPSTLDEKLYENIM